MTYYDAAMAGVVIAGMVWGAWKGITWQLASIASLVLGYTVAHPLSGQLAPQFPGEPVVARALAMLVVYAAVSGGVFLAAWIIRATLRKLQFEAFDRHLGMVLGGIEGALIGIVATLFVVSLAPQTRAPIFSSPTGQVVGQVMAMVGPVLPSEARTVLAPFLAPGDAVASGADDVRVQDQDADPAGRPEAQVARQEPRDSASPDAGSGNGQAQGGAGSSLRKMIDSEEARLSKAIVDTAEKEFRQGATGTATGGANDGSIERR